MEGAAFSFFDEIFQRCDVRRGKIINVDDLASAHIAALEYLIKKGTSRAFNLGTGQGHSVREVLEMVEQVSKIAVPHRAAERRPGDPATLVADNRAAIELLGWTPQQSSLHEIVESAWLWHAKSPKLRSAYKV